MSSTRSKAFYRFEVKFHSVRKALSAEAAAAYRSAGKIISQTSRSTNAVRSMAYRSGSAMMDRDGEIHDFTHRSKIIERSNIVAPTNAPAWVFDRQTLWSEVRAKEKRVDARWMQECIGSIAYGLDADQRWELATKFAQDIFVPMGMIVDYSIHLYGARIKPGADNFADEMAKWKEAGLPFLEADQAISNNEAHVMIERNKDGKILGYRLRQPHVHFSMPTRSISPDGFGLKPEEWWFRGRIREWRKAWEDAENTALKKAGRPERVDCRSLKAQESPYLPLVQMGKAQHASDDYEFVKKKKAKQADTKRYNSGVDAGMIARIVMGGVLGGPEGLALAAMGEFAPGLVTEMGAIPGTVINWLEGGGAKPSR